MKSFHLCLYLLIAYTLISCSYGTETKIHNQLDDTLVVEINDETYTLAPNRLVEVSYKYGENSIKSTYKNTVIVDTIVNITRVMTDEGALLNVTGKPYYIMMQRYGNSFLDNNPVYEQMIARDSTALENSYLAEYQENKRKRMLERMKIVVIDSVTIIGDIETIPANQIVIPRDWYYHLNSPFEESIETNNANDSYFGKSVKKIFSEKELVAYWNSEE
ncbi:hypothetical protein [Kordia jejudonensis]|uniref:hypothetical protein n=1 Tax=Kordia jejudonensis TaxID=1348245 RepID=UPI0012E05AE3|nr:hypothetical protein [Kordia jejudonensis]